jgi:hypothetical protein
MERLFWFDKYPLRLGSINILLLLLTVFDLIQTKFIFGKEAGGLGCSSLISVRMNIDKFN